MFLSLLCAGYPFLSRADEGADAPVRLIRGEAVMEAFAQGAETVPVIVTLKDADSRADSQAFTPQKGLQREARLMALKTRMNRLRDQALAPYSADELRLRHRYETLPGFSANVTLDGFEKLMTAPEVASIAPVRELQPNLKQGIPLIDGMTYRNQYGGAGVSVAIVDTGVDYMHPALGGGPIPNGKVMGGYDFGNADADPAPDGDAHGTAVAAIVAGINTLQGDYIGGVAPEARLYALKVSPGGSGVPVEDAVIAAWDWCVSHQYDDPANPILVIANAFGQERFTAPDACNRYSPLMTLAADQAVASGIAVIAASGNDGYTDAMQWPACISSVISVGSVYDAATRPKPFTVCIDPDTVSADTVPCNSNSASFLDFLAPAYDTATADLSGASGYSDSDYYLAFGGTSAATAYMAGAVAAIQSASQGRINKNLRVTSLINLVERTGREITDTKNDQVNARVNIADAVEAIVVAPPLPDPLPPVLDQEFEYNGFPSAPPTFENGYGASVSFAMGYYLRTYLAAKRNGWTAEDLESPMRQASPYFLWNNGGSDDLYLAAQLLEGRGAPTMRNYSSYFQTTDAYHLREAETFQSLGARPFFIHRPVLNKQGEFKGGRWNNDTNELKEWLDGGGAFVVGLPVYQSLLDYSPNPNSADVRNAIYTRRDTEDDPLIGFQAVCVVDYLQSVRAFKIVNSWGDDWGVHPFLGVLDNPQADFIPRGYAWISFEFIRDYAVEAWWMRDVEPVEVFSEPAYNGAAIVTKTPDYIIKYKGPGTLVWETPDYLPIEDYDPADGPVVSIIGGGTRDTLKIKLRNAPPFGTRLPVIQSDGGFRKLYTEAPIGLLTVGGDLKNLSTKNSHIETVRVGGILKKIRLKARPDSSWPEVASWHYRNAYVRSTTGKTLPDAGIEMKLPHRLYTRIHSTANHAQTIAAPAIQVRALGVMIREFIAPEQDISQIITESKVYGETDWSPQYVAFGGVDSPVDPVSVLSLNSVAGAAPQSASVAQPPIIGLDEVWDLLSQAQSTPEVTRVPVIVTLDAAASAGALADRLAHIDALQADLTDALTLDQFQVRRRYETVPAVSGLISADGLRQLAQRPGVRAVTPIRQLNPQMAQGLALMDGYNIRAVYDGSAVSIAVCDTGIDYRHPDLGGGAFPNAKVIGGYDFGDQDADPFPGAGASPLPPELAHGSAVAAIAAGDRPTTAAGDFIGGVAPGAGIYALKITSGPSDLATDEALIDAWDWCILHQNDDPDRPIMIVNTSFAAGRFEGNCDEFSPALTEAAATLRGAGITLFVASGNDGAKNAIAWPACLTDAVSVGAVYDAAFGPGGGGADPVTVADLVPWYSNTSALLDLLAPSEQAYTADLVGPDGVHTASSPAGDYQPAFDGTSAACAYAAGAAAILQTAARDLEGQFLSPDALKTVMRSSGDPVKDLRATLTVPRINIERAAAQIDFNPWVPEGEWERTWLTDITTPTIILNDAWFQIEVSPLFTNVIIDCIFDLNQGDFDLELYDASRQFLKGAYALSSAERLEARVGEPGTYYIRVINNAEASRLDYDLWWDDIASPPLDTLDDLIMGRQIGRITAYGGPIRPGGETVDTSLQPGGIVSENIKKITALGQRFTTRFHDAKIFLPYPADLSLGTLMTSGKKLKLKATGGVCEADMVLTGGQIPLIKSTFMKYWVNAFDPDLAGDAAWTKLPSWQGGVVGFAPAPTSLYLPKWMRVITGVAELDGDHYSQHEMANIYADLAVFGHFAAAPVEDVTDPNRITPTDRIKRIETRPYSLHPPRDFIDIWWYRVQGEAWSTKNPINIITEDHKLFIEH